MNRLKLGAAAILLAAITAGCIKTYVYEYSDGTRIETSSPNSLQTRIDVSDLRSADSAGETYKGTWTAQPWNPKSRQWVQVWFDQGNGSRSMFSVSERDLHMNATPAENGQLAFDIKRDAGTMYFAGPAVAGSTAQAAGEVTLQFDRAYMKELATITGSELTTEQKLKVFQRDLPIRYARAIKEAGYSADLDSLIDLRNAGVSEDYAVGLRKAGYAFDVKQVIGLSRNGINRSFAADLREAGFTLSDEQLIKLSRNGISTTFAKGMREAGYSDVDELINLSRNGVSTSYARDMGLGGKRPAQGLVDMNRSGVSPSFGRDMTQGGYQFTDQDLVKLGRNGVSSTFARSLLEVEYKFTADELVNLSRNGVSSDYAKRVREAGYDCSADDLVKLNRNGVSSTFIASLHDPKKPNLPVDALVDLSRRGVDAETVKKIRGM